MTGKQEGTTPAESDALAATQTHISGLSIAARLPQFWRDRPSLWFAQIEAILAPSKHSDEMKYQYVIANLERRDLEQVSDILLSPPVTEKYGAVKARLLQVYEESQELRLQRLVEGIDLGDAQPSQLLRRIRDLSGSSGTPDAVLQVLWLSKLPSHVRAVLPAVTADLNSLAQIADKVIGHCHPTATLAAMYRAPPRPNHTPATTNEVLSDIHRRLAALEGTSTHSHSSRRSTSNSRSRPPSRDRRKQARGNGCCWYHQRYGSQARKCSLPCTFAQGNGNQQH